jgi:hypothetical protein
MHASRNTKESEMSVKSKKQDVKNWLDPNGKKAEIDQCIAMANALITKAVDMAEESDTPLAMRIDAWGNLPTRLYLNRRAFREKAKYEIDEEEVLTALKNTPNQAYLMIEAIGGWDNIGVENPGWTYWRASSLEC